MSLAALRNDRRKKLAEHPVEQRSGALPLLSDTRVSIESVRVSAGSRQIYKISIAKNSEGKFSIAPTVAKRRVSYSHCNRGHQTIIVFLL
jgi:hypothetical protein